MAEALLTALVVDLVADAVVAVTRRLGRADHELHDRAELVRGAVRADEGVRDACESAVRALTEVPRIADAAGGEELRPFLMSPECAAILTDLVTFEGSDDAARGVDASRASFALTLTAWKLPIGRREADRIFDALLEATQRGLLL